MSRTVLCVDTDQRVSSVAATIEADDDLTAIEAASVDEAIDALSNEPIVGVVTAYDLADGTGSTSSARSEPRLHRLPVSSLPTFRRATSTPNPSRI